MGEIADAVLEGAFCCECGGYIDDGETPGYPRKCSGCEDGESKPSPPRRPRKRSEKCPTR